MHTSFARVVSHERLYGKTFLTWFAAPEIARDATPGQFVMLRCVDAGTGSEALLPASGLPSDPLLPRAMSIHRVRRAGSDLEWSVLYDVVGRGTAWLSERRAGDSVFCWGPLGRGFEVESNTRHVLLVAGGIGVAPLVWLADVAVQQERSVALVLGGRSEAQIFPTSHLPPEVEVTVMTEDGSVARRGLATEAFGDQLEWCDQAFVCGPNPMFAAMAEIVRSRRLRRPVQVLLEERMGCGTGICYGCAVETRRHGMRLVCKDGPMFELREIF
jgi:dihydroorotate dehydrogenase electron transfer subunit